MNRLTAFHGRQMPTDCSPLKPGASDKPPMGMPYMVLPPANGLKWGGSSDPREVMAVVCLDTVWVEAGRLPDCYGVVTTSMRADCTMRRWPGPDVGSVKCGNRIARTGDDGVRGDLSKRAELVRLQTTTAKLARMP